jgi:hypothetical protein
MTRAALLLPALLATGCLVVPATRTTTRQVGTEDGLATFAKAHEVQLETQVEGSRVFVKAKRIGECTAPVLAITETTHKKGARLGGASDPRAMVFGAVLAPITIPISALITGFAVAADDGTTTRDTKPVATKRYACSLEADQLRVTFTLPSGAHVSRTTTRDGRIVFDIPDTEAYSGVIALEAPMATSRQVAYSLPKPGITAAREAIVACASEHHVTGNVTVKLSIDNDGRATRVWLSRGDDAVSACVTRGLTDARFPDTTYDSTLSLPLTF